MARCTPIFDVQGFEAVALDLADRETSREVGRLVSEAERADGSSPISDQVLVAASRGEREAWGVRNLSDGASDGRLVAVGLHGVGEVDLVVAPAWRGRGIGTALLAVLLAAAKSPEQPLRAWAHGENPAATTLLTRSGFAPVRTLYRLTLDHRLLPKIAEDGPQQAVNEPFKLASIDPSDATQGIAWLDVNGAAFADHPEQGALTLDDFVALTLEEWFDANDLLLAWDTRRPGTLAGFTWIKTRGRETELYVIGVHPNYAGQGLGRDLLRATLLRMAEHRPERVTLYVDADNERAVDMYFRAGFEIDTVSRQWELPARTEPGSHDDPVGGNQAVK